MIPLRKIKCIISVSFYRKLPPPHGGKDPGKIGVNDCLEKDINLTLALRLQTLLENKSYHVVMTRTTDTSLADPSSDSQKRQDLQRRVDIITETAPVFTISIHQNSYSSESISGPQVFYYSDSEQGKILATYLQDSLNTYLEPSSPRSIKANNEYFILKNSPTPTIIVECGFLSNPREAELLTTTSYQDKVVRAIYMGIEEYMDASGYQP